MHRNMEKLTMNANTRWDQGMPHTEVRQEIRTWKWQQKVDPSTIARGLSHHKNPFAKIANNSYFQTFTLALVIVNACWIGFDVDFNNGPGSQVPVLVSRLSS